MMKHRNTFSTEVVKSLFLETDIQNLLGPDCEQLAVASPALTRGFGLDNLLQRCLPAAASLKVQDSKSDTSDSPVSRPLLCFQICLLSFFTFVWLSRECDVQNPLTGKCLLDSHNLGLVRVTKVGSGASHKLAVLQGVCWKESLYRYILNIFLQICEISFLSSYAFRRMHKLLWNQPHWN